MLHESAGRFALVVVEMPLVRYRLHGGNTHFNAALMEEAHRCFRQRVAAAPERYPAAVARTLLERPLPRASPSGWIDEGKVLSPPSYPQIPGGD